MPFDKHIFISYAHRDNHPPVGEKTGWIDLFHRELLDRLTVRLGYDPKIWRDERLAGNDDFSQEIRDQLSRTALLVSVLSPPYLNSRWCKREVDEFCRAAERSGGLSVGSKTRLFKVVKYPVELEQLPPVMQKVLGYNFFVYDGPDNALELDPAYGPDMLPLFRRQVSKLASQVAETIETIEDSSAGKRNGTGKTGPAKPVVYLAECGYDRGFDRDVIETELKAHGYTVLPDRQLPVREEEYVTEVNQMLEESALAVHLVGSHYGMVPYGPSGKSVPVLQNEAAIARSKAAGLPRIIWLPPGQTSTNHDQQRFIDLLQNDADAQYGADLIIGDVETVKTAIHTALRKLEQPKANPEPATPAAEGDARLAYLICDERDKDALRPLRKFLIAAGYQVRLPLFCSDAASVREHHQTMLAECDCVALYYGVGDEKWKATAENELWKMKAYRGTKPMPKRFTYYAQPATPEKTEALEFMEPGMIDGTSAFPQAALDDLLKS